MTTIVKKENSSNKRVEFFMTGTPLLNFLKGNSTNLYKIKDITRIKIIKNSFSNPDIGYRE